MKRLVLILALVLPMPAQNPNPPSDMCGTRGDVGRVWIQRNQTSNVQFVYACQLVGTTPTFEKFTSNKWVKYSILKTTGGWTVNSGSTITAAAATLQGLSLFTATDVYVDAVRLKTTTACAGVTTLKVIDLGTNLVSSQYTPSHVDYDLEAAVAVSNITWPAIAALPPTTASGSTTTILYVQSTGGNMTSVTTGCAFDVHVRYNTLDGQ